MQIQCKLRLKQLQKEYLKARYESRQIKNTWKILGKKKKVNSSHPGFALLSPQTLETLEEYMQQKHYSELIPLWRRGCNEIELCLIYDFVSVFKKTIIKF